MATVKFTIKDNSDEVKQLLRSAIGEALADIGLTVRDEASAKSPVKTGALRDSWITEVREADNTVVVGVPLDALKNNYAKYQELGTSRGVKPHHMLRNAVNNNKANFKGIVEIKLKNA